MEQQHLNSYVGNMQQLAYIRPVVFQEGRLSGARGYLLKNGPMNLIALADKCLDIAELQYRGVNFSFLAKPGMNGRNQFDTNGIEAQRSITGGLFFTCGTENICAPRKIDGREYPMHGRLRTTPAEHVCADAFWDEAQYRLMLCGEMREAELFGENMLLRRSITTTLGSNCIEIKDTVVNCAFREEPLYYMYHINFGYPIVDPAMCPIFPTKRIVPRDAISEQQLFAWNTMSEPAPNVSEQVFMHDLACDQDGNTFAALYNPVLGLGIQVRFNKNSFPYFMQWKSTASGDYVVGFEPSNASILGLASSTDASETHMLPPQTYEEFHLSFTILDGPRDYQNVLQQCANLLQDSANK